MGKVFVIRPAEDRRSMTQVAAGMPVAPALAAGRIESVEIHLAERLCQVFLRLPAGSLESLDPQAVDELSQSLGQAIGVPVALRLTEAAGESADPVSDLPAKLRQAWTDLMRQVLETLPAANGWLTQATWALRGQDNLVVYLPDPGAVELLTKRRLPALLARLLTEQLGFGGRVTLTLDPNVEHDPEAWRRAADEEEQALLRSTMEAAKKAKGSGKAEPGQTLRGRVINGQPRPVSQVTEEERGVVVQGEILGFETRELRTGRQLVSFDLTDYTDSLSCKFFLDPDEPPLSESLADGAWVTVKGMVQHDKFTQELTLMVDDMVLGRQEERQDDAPEKRSELHVHTKMSSMASVLEVEKAIKTAARWGHPAIAITDSGVVQAFPDAYALGQKLGIQVILGLEAYLVDDGQPIVIRPAATPLDDVEYVVVDIETTGLSPVTEEVIELGAVRVKGGQVAERFQAFVRPTKAISPKIQELTGITPDMVADAAGPEAVLERFREFLGDAVFVAHNAQFDSSFLDFHLRRLFGQGLTNPVLDTLWLSRSTLTHLRTHKLDAVAKELSVALEHHHRALDDAETAAGILIKLLARGRQDRPELATLADLNQLAQSIPPEQIRPQHCTLLVQNAVGLKNLYDLVSMAHLEHFFRVPRIPKSVLLQRGEGLLIGSACAEGALFDACQRGVTDEELREIGAFYDYFEIMPVANHLHLVDRGVVAAEEDLRQINRRICRLGQELGKPVCATGDVHYLEPRDGIYRQILTAGLGKPVDNAMADLHFRTTAEMLAEFSYLGEDVARQVVITEPARVAGLCEVVPPVPSGLYAPKIDGAEEQVETMSWTRARELYGDPLPDIVRLRLEKELKSIIGNGFSVIYLIAHKLVKKSMDDGYLVGSRGSVGSSLVATMMRITEVNPLPPHYRCRDCLHSEFIADGSVGSGFDLPGKDCPHCGTPMAKDGHDIPFETFLGFEGDKVPDIDLNFSGQNQNAIQKFTEELFGSDHVYRAGTIATVAEKTAFGFVKGYLEERGRTNVRRAEMGRLARGLSGVRRTTGQHPGGMIVVPRDREVTEFTPVQFPADDKNAGFRTTHFDFHSIHDNLLKLDILGHDDPTVLRLLQDWTGLDVKAIPFDDPATQALFSGLDSLGLKPEAIGSEVGTLGVPEFGTNFVRRMLLETRPKGFSDLVRISGLSHGTDVWTNNAQELIKNRTATLQDVIPCRDDIMVYLMYKGLEPGKAFKIMEKVRKGKGLTPEDEEYMRSQAVPDWYIDSCNKIKYMFPKAHAAAYVMMGFRIAWFKVHEPLAFYATYFTVRADNFDALLATQGPFAVQRKLEELEKKGNEATAKEKDLHTILEVVREMNARGFKLHPVDLYESDAENFKILQDGLLPPLSSLQGLGSAAAQGIITAREAGPFLSVEDLRARARVNKAVTELLEAAGCLKGLPQSNQLALF
ncbi:MAG: PolC-type DNA polymerase III [Symbiobacteriia bacterium]